MEKVLIVTYYWPPAGGPGVQRWLKFTRYLRDFGIEPVVYVPDNPHYPLQDRSLEDQVPDVEIIRKPILEPYAWASLLGRKETREISSGIIPAESRQGFLQRMLLFIRGNFFIPDARKFWVKPSIKFLSTYIREQGIRKVITTGPPHSLHLIGLGLKKQAGVKWVADFRDPWTSIGYHDKLRLTRFAQKRHRELERRVLQQADQLITTSFTTREEFQRITRTPIEVITNGYDQEKVPGTELDRKFTLAHIGSLLSGRNPETLWEALAELITENSDFATAFRLNLVGAVGEQVLESIRRAGLSEHLMVRGYVTHTEAMSLQRSSQMLLLIEIDSPRTRGIIPGKLFEYMVSGRPILAVGPGDADPKKIITQTNTGKFFEYDQKKEMKEYILSAFRTYQDGELRSHPVGLQQYSRKALTGQLAKILR